MNTKQLQILFDFLLFPQYARMLANFHAEQPHQHAVYYTSVLMAEQAWTKDEMLECIEGNYVLIIGS